MPSLAGHVAPPPTSTWLPDLGKKAGADLLEARRLLIEELDAVLAPADASAANEARRLAMGIRSIDRELALRANSTMGRQSSAIPPTRRR
ncbi:MAG: hypothetical protein U0974_02130 [Gemmatimonadales bacterium]|nr:hypothetical protein [Gemmatimonadales bacterium]